MRTMLITHPACLAHDTGPGHPERPARLQAVLDALDTPAFAGLTRAPAPPAPLEALLRAHGRRHVDAILAIQPAPGDYVALDADTIMSSGSATAALYAAGGAIAAVDHVMASKTDAAFVAVRPPGHHAEPLRAMGFCLFNNVAVAAHHARAHWRLKRLAIADFDVHHGNGTQAMFAADADVFYASSHQSLCYPGTGCAGETGVAGNI
ncbi:MAG: histone deacetylase family protein, partial [Alphaproteobacteria bacterium]